MSQVKLATTDYVDNKYDVIEAWFSGPISYKYNSKEAIFSFSIPTYLIGSRYKVDVRSVKVYATDGTYISTNDLKAVTYEGTLKIRAAFPKDIASLCADALIKLHI